MTNSGILKTDTVLYHPAEPEGRTFPAGEPWPGDAWSDKPGGEVAGKETGKAAIKDLKRAQDQIESLQLQVQNAQHSAAQADQGMSEAVAQVDGLEQRAVAAEKALAEAEEAARGYMVERDAARSDLKAEQDAHAKAKEEAAKVAGLVEQLNTANQTIADLKDGKGPADEPAPPKTRAKKPATPAADA